MKLVRRIDAPQWTQRADGKVLSYSVRQCIKVDAGNDLSVWKIETDADLDNAVLAIAGGWQRRDDGYFVAVSEEQLRDLGVNIEDSVGDTPFVAYADKHCDLKNLSNDDLTIYANLVNEEITNNNDVHYRWGKLKGLVKAALDDGRINENDVADEFKR